MYRKLDKKTLFSIINFQSEIVNLGLNLQCIMQLVAERAMMLTHADGAAIELREDNDLVYRAVVGALSPFLGLRLSIETSLSGLVAIEGVGMECRDSEKDPRVDRSATRKIGSRSMVIVPLMHNYKVVGVLKVISLKPRHFHQEDEIILNLLSTLIGSVMYFSNELNDNHLYHQATHDSLTQLANRSAFVEKLNSLTGQINTKKNTAAVVILDLNGLKFINDNYGHLAGDTALKEAAFILCHATRESDLVARLGGDEFALVVNSVNDKEELEIFISRVQGHFNKPFEYEGKSLSLSVSVGGALYPDDADTPEKLIALADKRMYANKRVFYERTGKSENRATATY